MPTSMGSQNFSQQPHQGPSFLHFNPHTTFPLNATTRGGGAGDHHHHLRDGRKAGHVGATVVVPPTDPLPRSALQPVSESHCTIDTHLNNTDWAHTHRTVHIPGQPNLAPGISHEQAWRLGYSKNGEHEMPVPRRRPPILNKSSFAPKVPEYVRQQVEVEKIIKSAELDKPASLYPSNALPQTLAGKMATEKDMCIPPSSAALPGHGIAIISSAMLDYWDGKVAQSHPTSLPRWPGGVYHRKSSAPRGTGKRYGYHIPGTTDYRTKRNQSADKTEVNNTKSIREARVQLEKGGAVQRPVIISLKPSSSTGTLELPQIIALSYNSSQSAPNLNAKKSAKSRPSSTKSKRNLLSVSQLANASDTSLDSELSSKSSSPSPSRATSAKNKSLKEITESIAALSLSSPPPPPGNRLYPSTFGQQVQPEQKERSNSAYLRQVRWDRRKHQTSYGADFGEAPMATTLAARLVLRPLPGTVRGFNGGTDHMGHFFTGISPNMNYSSR